MPNQSEAPLTNQQHQKQHQKKKQTTQLMKMC